MVYYDEVLHFLICVDVPNICIVAFYPRMISKLALGRDVESNKHPILPKNKEATQAAAAVCVTR